MSSLHLVDPELRPLLEQWPTARLDDDVLRALRAAGRAVPLPPIAPDAVRKELLRVPGPAGAPEVPLTLYRPPQAAAVGCVYHIHGGGFVLGEAATLEHLHRPLAEALGCAIVSVDYRLAPETRFPGAIEDCHAGLRWIVANAARLGIDPARIGVMGESAGGGLAAALALLARDRGGPRLAFQLLTYPMLDDRTCAAADPHPHTGEFIWTPHNNRFGWSALLGAAPGGATVSPYAAPARAETLAGLPPAFVTTGALDLFLEEDMDFARRLLRAGVPTELHVYPGAFHGFDATADTGVGARAHADRLAALRRFLKTHA